MTRSAAAGRGVGVSGGAPGSGRAAVLFILWDGVGIGPDDPEINPFAGAKIPNLRAAAGGEWPVLGRADARRGETSDPGTASLHLLDASMGVPGLPQSATGQTALLTGVNAAAVMGRHVSAYPPQRLRALLRKKGIFARLREMGMKVTFLNSFRPESEKAMELGTYRATATTEAALGAGVPLRGFEHLRRGEAVPHDITGESLARQGYDLKPVPAERAGEVAASVAVEHDFTLFEFFLTDIAGHRRDAALASMVIERFDRFFGVAARLVARSGGTVVLVSDHGNVEDVSTGTHTRNPVPLLWIGRGAPPPGRVGRLTDVAPLVAGVAYAGRAMRGGRSGGGGDAEGARVR